jgi:hypothetical protein
MHLKGPPVKCAGSAPHGKHKRNPSLFSLPIGCNITDLLQEIAYSVQEDYCLKRSPPGYNALASLEHLGQGDLNMKLQIEKK